MVTNSLNPSLAEAPGHSSMSHEKRRGIESRSDAAALGTARTLGSHANEVCADPTLLLLEANVA